jgi:hypothetical protein
MMSRRIWREFQLPGVGVQQSLQGRNWSELVQRRLSRSMALSVVLLVALLSLVRFRIGTLDFPVERKPMEVLLPSQPERQPAELPVPVEAETEDPEATESPLEPEATDATEIVPQQSAEAVEDKVAVGAGVDWYAELERVSAEIAAQKAEPNSVNPHFDELRRVARLRYGKPQNDPPRPIWENVETDYLGRTILRDGDCFRIIDDPAVGNRYVFENFQQYMVYCTYQPSKPRDLPWVKEIQSRYGYLRRDKEPLATKP